MPRDAPAEVIEMWVLLEVKPYPEWQEHRAAAQTALTRFDLTKEQVAASGCTQGYMLLAAR